MKTSRDQKNIAFLNQNRNIIDLDPAFQRSRVWRQEQKQLLIDTLMKNWGIPKVYFASYKDNENSIYRYECIDGKQRLTTIFDFFDNEFSVEINNKKKFYKDLDVATKESLANYQLDVELVEEFKENELSELYQRLQSGSVLNTSEKLKATSGLMSKFIYKQSENKLFKTKIISKAKRYPHIATVAQVALLSIKNDIVNLKFKDLLTFLENYKSFNINSEEAKKIKRVLKHIDDNFNISEARIVFTNRAIFVSCFYLISYLMLRGDISKINIKSFFVDFTKKLSAANKNSNTTDISLKDFQISVIQGADSSTSIKKRHKILLESLVKFDKNAKSLVNYETLEEEFRALYKSKLEIFNGNHSDLNSKLISMKCKIKFSIQRSQKTPEALPVYIRHSDEHPSKSRNYKYTYSDLEYSVSFLKKVIQP